MDKIPLSFLVSRLGSLGTFSLPLHEMLQSLNLHCHPYLSLPRYVYISLELETPAPDLALQICLITAE